MSGSGLANSLLQATRRPAQKLAHNASQRLTILRPFSSLPSLRPSLTGLHAPGAIAFRPATAFSPSAATTTTATTAGGDAATLDLVPRTAISAHPALAGAFQMRCGPRPTMSNASRLIRARRHGFLSRIRTANGRKTLKRRMAKGRKKLSA